MDKTLETISYIFVTPYKVVLTLHVCFSFNLTLDKLSPRESWRTLMSVGLAGSPTVSWGKTSVQKKENEQSDKSKTLILSQAYDLILNI